ncbi:hypothetical protein QP162_08445 [Sphingomonas aurantiaca]
MVTGTAHSSVLASARVEVRRRPSLLQRHRDTETIAEPADFGGEAIVGGRHDDLGMRIALRHRQRGREGVRDLVDLVVVEQKADLHGR